MKVKDFLPPVITDFAKRNQKIKTYETYEEALSFCSQDAYQNEELCNMIADKTIAHIQQLTAKPYSYTPTTVYLAFALNYFASLTNKQGITVVDFGGACGAHYFEIRNTVAPHISLKWIVVETEQMIKASVSRGLSNGELCFVSSVENLTEEVDFVHSSSALQYVPRPYDFLKGLLSTGAKMILFNRMMFNKNNHDIITVQRSLLSSNGPGKLPSGYTDKPVKYPHTTMSYDKMNSAMTANGYECFSEFDEPSGKFSLGKEEVLGKGLLFVKKDLSSFLS